MSLDIVIVSQDSKDSRIQFIILCRDDHIVITHESGLSTLCSYKAEISRCLYTLAPKFYTFKRANLNDKIQLTDELLYNESGGKKPV